METTIIHIAQINGTKRTKTCDATPLIPPGPEDTKPKELCEKCRVAFIKGKK